MRHDSSVEPTLTSWPLFILSGNARGNRLDIMVAIITVAQGVTSFLGQYETQHIWALVGSSANVLGFKMKNKAVLTVAYHQLKRIGLQDTLSVKVK